jgi:hypothetical protein
MTLFYSFSLENNYNGTQNKSKRYIRNQQRNSGPLVQYQHCHRKTRFLLGTTNLERYLWPGVYVCCFFVVVNCICCREIGISCYKGFLPFLFLGKQLQRKTKKKQPID